MSEQRIIETGRGVEAGLPELARDAPADLASSVAEIEQLMAAVRQQLTELVASVRSDLEGLRGLAGDPTPTHGSSPSTVSDSRGASERREAITSGRDRVSDPSDVSRRVNGSRPGVEVERKFIVSEPPPELERLPAERISQGYVTVGDDGLEMRLRRRGEKTTMTVKKGRGRTRREEEIPVESAQFERLWPLTEGRRIEKVRYLIPSQGGLTIELDIYANELDGLCTAEVEFDSEARADAFEPPQWFGPEVTDDPRYRNARLARDAAPLRPRAASEPFCLDRREQTTEGIRRIVCGQIDAAIDDLGAGSQKDPGEAVHASRKRFKRVRATARLVRGELGADAYGRENVAFRDLGRRLSGARDSQVLLETLDALRERFASEVPSGAFARLRAELVDDHRATERRLRESAAATAPIIAELRAARTRVGAWRLRHEDVSALAPGFERIYRRGRSAFRTARKNPTDENLHELRKRSKDLWHAAQILGPTAPTRMKLLADRAHRLSDLVGDDHDLAILSLQAERRPECLPGEGEAALLRALIARRRRRIQREAIKLAHQIFAAQPKKLARPIRQARRDELASSTSPAS